MIVWQARVKRVQIGIAVTRHLLQAKIIDSDSTASREVKSGANAIAITKFVSNIIKIPAQHYHEAQSQAFLAAKIGLPVFLVDLRNEVNHGNRSWFGGQTVRMALDMCYKWIKDFYWDKEYAKYTKQETTENSTPQTTTTADTDPEKAIPLADTATTTDKTTEATSTDKALLNTGDEAAPNTPSNPEKLKSVTSNELDEWEFAEEQLRLYCTDILEKPRPSFPLLAEVLHAIQDKYEEDPQECIDALVSIMFLPSYIKNFRAKFANAEKSHECNCFFKLTVIQRYIFVMKILNQFPGAFDLLISSLLNKSSTDFKEIASQWITIIAESQLGFFCKASIYHHFHFPYTSIVQWERIVEHLYLIRQEWSYKLGLRIMESPKTNFTQDQINNVISLIKAYKRKRIAPRREADSKKKKVNLVQKKKDVKEQRQMIREALHREEKEEESKTLEEWFDVNDILKSSLDHSTFAFNIAKMVKESLKTSENEDVDDVTPLGILPHQRGNPLFYKELLLHYPSEHRGLPATDSPPPAKRSRI
ncbi:uncharacterized protein LOC122251317 [Penaeus japonicus]|uniref:uncharacterized protein LOC122251317 n=1 Tax=Penaeus japonicus TaxID=27405 RepID=UPI001C716CB8|nr:uncharacterized protein LOC122251317 [Penaeus japonicus]